MSRASDAEGEERGEGSRVWAILANNRQEGKASVQDDTNPDPGGHDPEDGVMRVKQEHSKAGEGKEKGDME